MFSGDDLVAEARAKAAAGHEILEVMEGILAGLGPDFSNVKFIMVLSHAFDVPLPNLKDLTLWDRLDNGGQLSTVEAIELVRPWLVAAGASDGAGGASHGST